MQNFWKITRLCSNCGENPEAYAKGDRINSFEISYSLCEDCYKIRGNAPGLDLLPIDGTQECFYCKRPASCVSENQDVFFQARQRRIHYSCTSCKIIESEAFQRTLTCLNREYPQTEFFPADLIRKMDEEIQAAIRKNPPMA